MTQEIPIVDLALRGAELEAALTAIRRVLERGWFILGPEVDEFETELASAVGLEHAVAVGSGTDALILGLKAGGVGPGDEVIVPAFTAFPTAAAVMQVGAAPVLVDVESHRPLLDLDRTMAAITDRTKAVILVHLYGIVADAPGFSAALAERGVALIEDCAQAQGGRLDDGRSVGAAASFGAFSFYPTKNLAGIGDGGAVVTDDASIAADVRAWRAHGERAARYVHELPARNSRLDDVQAALLRLRLEMLSGSLSRRVHISGIYEQQLPAEAAYTSHGSTGAPHLAVIRSPARDELAARLKRAGIGTGVHYPRPLHRQPALRDARSPRPLPNAERWAESCLSLPLHASLTDTDVGRVVVEVTRQGSPWR